MASVVSNCAAIVKGRLKDEVFVATMPLRATKGPTHLFMSAAYNLNLWDLQHFMVIIKHYQHVPLFPLSLTLTSLQFFLVFFILLRLCFFQVLVFDFQPKDPEDIYVALQVLSGRAVPGTLLVRKLKTMPRRKCWLVGYSKGDGVEIASEFNKKWETKLRVGLNDCRHYTNGLVEQLTGEKDVLNRLRNNHS
ncbi:hypothetical protein TanjilG_19155 [Lupinus angustifolius]|uniref:Uncharacterized protein n=1 Tax=Lupinus angustifolius TaxID=3871 RepID=A0A4P1RS04_LUPAN|nr:PREDICTED: uncharacterized protein LOC109342162 isoform X1 [Lupinus angustifolius]XP_019435754.1 PREDICTED: uncharacterized protein LOC109342162 isoform X1 [Lupinus angustifolius]OIW16439.1 hypothetical protein TanjilG_19155 [Lupinus angustifolius]